MLTSEQIEAAKARHVYSDPHDIVHEHDDCVRIAYEWLDAQTTIKGVMKGHIALKHVIERWGGRYVSRDDVEIAARLHPRIKGRYPYFNLSAKLCRPSDERLNGIGEARTQGYHKNFRPEEYKKTEVS